MSRAPVRTCTDASVACGPDGRPARLATPPLRRAWIGLGSNLPSHEGNPVETLKAARAHIDALPDTQITGQSRLYRSAPFEAEGPDFFNQVLRVQTRLPATALLTALQVIEHRFGRQRPWRNAPRTLDLDLLMLEGVLMHNRLLTLPHPRLHERLFVLMPLAELDPQLQVPGHVGNVATLLADLQTRADDQHCEVLAPAP